MLNGVGAHANLLYKFHWEMLPVMKNQDLDFDVLRGVTMHEQVSVLMSKKY